MKEGINYHHEKFQINILKTNKKYTLRTEKNSEYKVFCNTKNTERQLKNKQNNLLSLTHRINYIVLRFLLMSWLTVGNPIIRQNQNISVSESVRI